MAGSWIGVEWKILLSTAEVYLRRGLGHVGVWVVLWIVAAFMARYSCTEYNKIAGTDLTSGEILKISTSIILGPMVGPIANPGVGNSFRSVTKLLAAVLLFLQIVAVSPFVFFGRNMPFWANILSWIFFVVCGMAWFFSGLVSLGLSLM